MESNPDQQPPPYGEKNGMNEADPQMGQPAQQFAYTNPVSPQSTPYNPQQPQQPYGQPYVQPVAQPYGHPVAQPYSRPVAQPYSQPVAQSYGHPVAQPYGQQMVVQPGVNNYGVPQTTVQMGYVTQPQQPYVIQQPMVAPIVPESKKAKKLNLASAILSIIIAVLFIVGIATNYWTSGPGFVVGLFRACVSAGGHVCGPYFSPSGGIIIPGVIFYAIGLILNVVVAFTKASNKRGMLTGAIVMYCLTVFFVVIAVGVYGGFLHDVFYRAAFSPYRYNSIVLSWSFGLTCLIPFGGLILAILAGMSCSEYASSVRVVVVGGAPAPAPVVLTANTRI